MSFPINPSDGDIHKNYKWSASFGLWRKLQTHSEDEVDSLLAGKSDSGHGHDGRYYTETEVNSLLNTKEPQGTTHDERYYREDEIDIMVDDLEIQINGKANTSHSHNNYVVVGDDISIAGHDLRSYNSGDSQITGLVGGTAAGLIIEGSANQHVVIGLRDNLDTFSVISNGTSTPWADDPVYRTLAMKLESDGDLTIKKNFTVGKSIYLPSTGYDGAGQLQSTGVVRVANGGQAQRMYTAGLAATDSWAEAANYLTVASGDGRIYAQRDILVGRNQSNDRGYLMMTTRTGSLPGYPTSGYAVLKTDYSSMYFSVGGSYSAHVNSAGVWTGVSSRAKKHNFTDISWADYVTKMANVEVQQYQYIEEYDPDQENVYIGPYAEDMKEQFNLGDGTMISDKDTSGVALLGVKHLLAKVQELEARIATLEQ